MQYSEFMEWTRTFRSKHLDSVGKQLIKIGATANHLTTLSHILGLFAVYFLFQNHLFFIIFLIFHLSADALDGVVARLTKPTRFGCYYDHIGDQIIAFFLLLRVYFYLDDYYVLIILGIFTTTNLIYFISRMRFPVIFVRTGTAATLLFYPLATTFILTGMYLVVGGFLTYSLAKQLTHFLTNKS
jgi:phosphatidylglycerophosphate synthase